MKKSAMAGPLMTKEKPIEKTSSKVDGLKRGWCLFEARRRCYVEGILLEKPGQKIALSAPASLRVRDNMHLKLIGGEFPETKEVPVLDINDNPSLDRNGKPKTMIVVKDDELLELDGDPKVGPEPADFADDQFAMKHALVNGKRAPGS